MLLAYGGIALLGASHGKSFGGNIGWENFLPMGGARPMGAFLTFDNLAPKYCYIASCGRYLHTDGDRGINYLVRLSS